jgi:hypothetical protein
MIWHKSVWETSKPCVMMRFLEVVFPEGTLLAPSTSRSTRENFVPQVPKRTSFLQDKTNSVQFYFAMQIGSELVIVFTKRTQ